MSAHPAHSVSPSAGSFFVVAAWYSFIMPLFSPFIWFAIVVGTDGYLGVAFTWALCILITSFISGVVSVFGFSRHGRKRLLWLSVLGTVASAVLGFMSYVYLDMLKTWHG